MIEHDLPPPDPPRTCRISFGIAKTNEDEEFPLKIVTVEMVPSVSWGVLSACPSCCSDYKFFGVSDIIFSPPLLDPDPNKRFMLSVDAVVGESPSFMSPTVIDGPLPEGQQKVSYTVSWAP